MIRHQVYFWLKSPSSRADRDQLIAGLRALAQIELVRALYIGVPARTGQRDVVDNSFDVSELMLFDSVAEQDLYQDHPLHRQFVIEYGHLWQRVIVYDSSDV